MLHNCTFYFCSPSFFFFSLLSVIFPSLNLFILVFLSGWFTCFQSFLKFIFLVIKVTICNVFWLVSYRMWRPANETQSFSRIFECSQSSIHQFLKQFLLMNGFETAWFVTSTRNDKVVILTSVSCLHKCKNTSVFLKESKLMFSKLQVCYFALVPVIHFKFSIFNSCWISLRFSWFNSVCLILVLNVKGSN